MRNTPSGSAHEFGIHTFSPTTGNLTPSPIIDADGSIHILLDDGDLFAFDPDGNILWRYPTGGQGSSTAAIGASGDIYLALDNGNLLSLGLAKPIFARQEQRYWNQAGETVPYTLLLQNLTGPADRYLLSFQDNTWPVTLSVTETEVMLPGEVFTITVEVAIPNDAQTGDEDNVTIVATSEHWPEMTATTTLNSLVELGEGAWPMFHHDPTHSGRSLFTGPLTNTLAWAEPLFFSPGVYASAAIALDGTIYIGGNDGYLHAISPAGTVLWSTYLKGYLQSSPAISRGDGTIYVGSDDGNLYALDPQNGDILWTFQTPERIASSPTISADDLIYFGSDNGKLYALNPDGSFRWSYQTGLSIRSSPAVDANGDIYFGSDDSYVYALYPNGALKWSHLTSGRVGGSPTISTGGVIYVGSENTPSDGYLYALNPADGLLVWAEPFDPGGVVYTTPAIAADGTIIFGAHNGNVYALHPDGSLYWTFTTTESAWVRSSPAIGADGIIYIGSYDRTLYAIQPDGVQLWEYFLGGQVEGSPAIGPNGRLYVGTTEGDFYAFGP
jgi:outer membrane protein assembly factor BamB